MLVRKTRQGKWGVFSAVAGIAVVVAAALLMFGAVLAPAYAASVSVGGNTQTIDDTDQRFSYSKGDANNGGWDAGGSGDAAATEHWSNTAGATCDISFNGTGFELVGIKAPNHRFLSVAIDGGKPVEVDCYAPQRTSEASLFHADGLRAGEHVAHVVALDKTNPAVSGATVGVSLQYAVVFGASVDMDTAVPVEVDDAAAGNGLFQFDFKGDWHAESGYPGLFFEGTDHYSNTVGDSWSMRFTGSKIDVYGSTNPSHGIYSVEIDGAPQKDIVATAESAQHKQLLGSYKGLDSKKEHTITVSLKSGGAIQVDYVVAERKPVAATDFMLSDQQKTLESGGSFKLSYSVAPEGAVDPGATYVFDEHLLAIDSDGVVTARKVSQKTVTAITATLNNKSAATHQIEVTIFPEVTSFNAFVGNEKLLDTQEDWELKKSDHTDSWKGTAWQADERASKIGVATRADGAKNVRIVTGDLVSAEGSVISGKSVEVKWLRDVQAKEGRNAQGELKSYPDVLYYDNTGLDIPANTLQYAWLTIPVAADTKPGTYTGTMQVVADGVEPVDLTYTLEVIGIKQPTTEEANFEVQVWQHPFSVSGYYFANSTADAATGTGTNAPIETFMSEKHKDLLRGSMKEYASIGGHDLVANIVEEAWNHQSFWRYVHDYLDFKRQGRVVV